MSEQPGTQPADDTAPAGDERLPHLEDAATPDAKAALDGEHGADEQIRGEWQRAGEMQQESDHLREVLDDARQAVQRASDADSMESGGLGVLPEDVQDTGSGKADESDEEEVSDEERARS